MSIQGNINQIIGLTGAALVLGKKTIGTKKPAASETPPASAETKQPTAENWLENLDSTSRGIYDSLGDAAKKQVLEQSSESAARREVANVKAMARVESRRKQKDNYSKFMAELTGRDERRFERGDNADNK
nr:MAG TPA: hypothetical protein [Bacteriophage sp.]